MNEVTASNLLQKKCVACEGGVPVIDAGAATPYLAATPDWSISDDGTMISLKINAKNFVRAMAMLETVAKVAEDEQHHPDLHLTGYRHVRIDMTTHAIGGLSENDFIVAAKIDAALKS
jgi:4a-hydroxytetrahydrobiopterin dehydratase